MHRRTSTLSTRRHQSARGLTIVEVMVAMTVLTVILLPIGAFAVRSVGVTRDASESLIVSQRVSMTNMGTSQLLMDVSDVVVSYDYLEFLDLPSARDYLSYLLAEPAAYNTGATGSLLAFRDSTGNLGYVRLVDSTLVFGDGASERILEQHATAFAARRIADDLVEIQVTIDTPGARTDVEMVTRISLLNASQN